MLRDLLSDSRHVKSDSVFFVLVVGSSLLYSWHVQRTTEGEFGKRLDSLSVPNRWKTSRKQAPHLLIFKPKALRTRPI